MGFRRPMGSIGVILGGGGGGGRGGPEGVQAPSLFNLILLLCKCILLI